MRIEASLALFATSLASETAEINNSAPHGAATEKPIHSEEQVFFAASVTDEDILAIAGGLADQVEIAAKKFSDWTSEQRAALADVPAEALSRLSEEARHLQSTGDGYTAVCNPFLGTCTCNSGDYWQLGWCQQCQSGCATCTSERNCNSCNGNMVLDEFNSCKCTAGEYDSSTKTCATSCSAG